MNLSIIIPMYNEEKNIIVMLNRLLAVKMPNFLNFVEYIIIDDASTDNSYKTVLSFINSTPNFFLYKNEQNQGKGASVRKGLTMAKGDVFLVQDADLELSPNDIPRMLIAMNDLNVEFINGSRYLPGVIRPLASYRRYLGNRFFSWLTSLIINVRITDMACGYKLFHRNIYKEITLKENRFGFEAELLIKALRIKKNNIAEIPVQYFPRNQGEGKKIKNSDAFKILWTIIKYAIFKKQ